MNKRGLSYLLASFDFESGHDQMLPQPPLCTSTVFFCFPSSSSSSSSSAFSSFFLPAPQRPNTYFRGQTRRKGEIDVSAREAQQTRENEKKGTENTPARTKNQERAATPSSSSFVDRRRPSDHCSPFCRLLLLLRVRRRTCASIRTLSNVVVEIDLLSCIAKYAERNDGGGGASSSCSSYLGIIIRKLEAA
jgi:hypothetical protein